MKFAIDLNETQAEALREIASALGVPVEELARAAVTDLVSQPSAEFNDAVAKVLEKNRELYDRLS
jgi:fructose-1,6-bisphosphatase/sedoheptulose 1,7-bisphosphatase-like protein